MKRRTKLKAWTPLRRRTPLRTLPPEADSSRRPPELVNEEFITWLRLQPCRVTGKRGPNEAHHLRHDANGAALGKNRKDDNRAITLSSAVHVPQLHGNAGFFKGWTRARIRAWEDEQLACQRREFLAWKAAQEAQAKPRE